MAKVRTLPPGFEAVSQGMAEQSGSAGQISEDHGTFKYSHSGYPGVPPRILKLRRRI